MRRGALLAVVVVTGCLAAGARAAVPADIAQRIASAARDGREGVSRAAAQANQIGDPAISRMLAARARDQAASALCAVVIGAIAENPALAGEIVADARAAAPELAPDVSRRVTEAYPFLTLQAPPPAPTPAPALEVAEAPAPAAGPRTAMAMEPEGPPAATDDLPEPIYDPLEDVNRGIFAFNDVFDTYVLRPIAWTYGKVLPDRVKAAVRHFFRNLGSPVRFANDGMQGEFGDAGNTLVRFAINSTVGVAGLFEVAEDWGYPYKPSDFGITMHSYGVNSGPYLIMPFLGPTTARDGVALAVDSALNPLTWLVDTKTNAAILGGRIVSLRESFIEPLDQLKKGSVDYYAALRSAYYQNRATELRKGEPVSPYDLDKQFDEAK